MCRIWKMVRRLRLRRKERRFLEEVMRVATLAVLREMKKYLDELDGQEKLPIT